MLQRKSWELMARGLSEGLSQTKAYMSAGYSHTNAGPAASLLLKNHPEIRKRAKEIREQRYRQMDSMIYTPILDTK